MRVALLVAVLSLVGCSQIEGIPVDYGPEVSVTEIQKAIIAGVQGIDPSATQKDAAVQYTTTQYLAGGQVVNLLSSTTLWVKERTEVGATAEDPPTVVLTVEEIKTPVPAPGEEQAQDLRREFRLVFEKGSPLHAYAVEGSAAPLSLSPPLKPAMKQATKVSFHRLTSNVSTGAPPVPASQKANCRNIPGCLMNYNRIAFDQVAWKEEGPEKIHFDFITSPQVPQISGFNMSPLFPYYQGLVKSCVTLLVQVGDSHDKVLVMECQQVQDFVYGTKTP